MLRDEMVFSNDQHLGLLQILYFAVQDVVQLFLSANNTFQLHTV